MRLLERLRHAADHRPLWVEHLTAMDEMRQGIGLQAYGQQDPLVAYKREAHDMWGQLLGEHPQPHRALDLPRRDRRPGPPDPASADRRGAARCRGDGARVAAAAGGAPASIDDQRAQRAVASAAGVKAPPRNLRTNQPAEAGGGRTVVATKVGRNDPCPCGSGKKYKKCHGAAA